MIRTRPGLPPFRDPTPAPRRKVGKVTAVSVEQLGGSLVGDHSAGDTTMFLDDVTDFEEVGGHATIEDSRFNYESLSDFANTLALADPLAADHSDGTWVAPCHGLFIPTHALADVDVGLGDIVQAIVPHSLRPLLSPGNRKPNERESVRIVNHGDDRIEEWWVADILGQTPDLPEMFHWTHLAPLDTTPGLRQRLTAPCHFIGARIQVREDDTPTSDLTADVLLNGTSIFGSGPVPTIAAGADHGGIAVADYVPGRVDDYVRGQILGTGGSTGPLLMQMLYIRGL